MTVHIDFTSKYANHPKVPDAMRNIGNCQRDLGDANAARSTWNKLIKLISRQRRGRQKAKQQLAALKEGDGA